jgi:hypothetical protein
VNPLFASTAFWQPYLTLEPVGMSNDDFVAQLENLRSEFDVRVKPVRFEYDGRQRVTIRRSVAFTFACGPQFSLEVEYHPEGDGCDKTLYLLDSRSGTKNQMGWWDLGRWHPYGLRPEELDSLLRYWSQRDSRWEGEDLPMLLLCQFVGLPDEAALTALEGRVQTAAQKLGLSVSDKPPFEIPLQVADGHY